MLKLNKRPLTPSKLKQDSHGNSHHGVMCTAEIRSRSMTVVVQSIKTSKTQRT